MKTAETSVTAIQAFLKCPPLRRLKLVHVSYMSIPSALLRFKIHGECLSIIKNKKNNSCATVIF